MLARCAGRAMNRSRLAGARYDRFVVGFSVFQRFSDDFGIISDDFSQNTHLFRGQKP